MERDRVEVARAEQRDDVRGGQPQRHPQPDDLCGHDEQAEQRTGHRQLCDQRRVVGEQRERETVPPPARGGAAIAVAAAALAVLAAAALFGPSGAGRHTDERDRRAEHAPREQRGAGGEAWQQRRAEVE